MPHKHLDSKRHKFNKMKYKVTNWPEYNEALRRRGDITIWVSDDTIEAWHPEKIPGRNGRPLKYSDMAIECCLMLRQVYHLPLRQTEGFLNSIIRLMGLNISSPDHTTASRRLASIKLGIV